MHLSGAENSMNRAEDFFTSYRAKKGNKRDVLSCYSGIMQKKGNPDKSCIYRDFLCAAKKEGLRHAKILHLLRAGTRFKNDLPEKADPQKISDRSK